MLTISFDFDEKSKTISNLQVVEKEDLDIEDESSQILLTSNKLIFSKKALSLMSATSGDRIAINYAQHEGQTFPVIGKSEYFSDPDSGNKLTKSNSILFKGIQNDMLKQFGTKFELENYLLTNTFKLIKIE